MTREPRASSPATHGYKAHGYNRKVKSAAFCLAVLLLAACSKNIDTPEAVKAGVLKDIATKVDVASMDVSVDSVSFQEKEANATVSFRPKGADTSQAIVMNYVLERQGDDWKIKSRNMASQHEHTEGQTALPPGHPHVDPNQTKSGQTP
jgi:hypothetical protein